MTAAQDLDRSRLPQALRRIRIERGMDMGQMAVLFGVHTSVISRFESGKTSHLRMSAPVAADVLGITVGELMAPCPHCGYEPDAGYRCMRCGTAGPDWKTAGRHAEAAS